MEQWKDLRWVQVCWNLFNVGYQSKVIRLSYIKDQFKKRGNICRAKCRTWGGNLELVVQVYNVNGNNQRREKNVPKSNVLVFVWRRKTWNKINPLLGTIHTSLNTIVPYIFDTNFLRSFGMVVDQCYYQTCMEFFHWYAVLQLFTMTCLFRESFLKTLFMALVFKFNSAFRNRFIVYTNWLPLRMVVSFP